MNRLADALRGKIGSAWNTAIPWSEQSNRVGKLLTKPFASTPTPLALMHHMIPEGETTVGDIAEMAPVVGDVADAYRAQDAYRKGNKGEAAMYAGAVLLPGALQKSGKAVSRALRKFPDIDALGGGGRLLEDVDVPMDQASRMARAQELKYTTPVYTGSTHVFSEPDASLANPENDFGRAFYASTTPADVNRNYARSTGADLTSRIAQKREQLEWEIEDDPEILERFGFTRETYDADPLLVRDNIARQTLTGDAPEGIVYPMLANTEEYVRLGADNPSHVTDPDYYQKALDELDPADYAEEWELEDAAMEYADQMRYDDPESAYNRIADALRYSDVNDTEQMVIMEKLGDSLADGDVSMNDLNTAIRETAYDVEDEMGNLLSPGEISRQVFQELGYKGIVDPTASVRFNMGGIDPTTRHIMAFPGHENTMRSVNAAFDPAKKNSRNLLASILALGGVGALARMQQEEPEVY
jgi:hypothetical protein